MTSTGRKLEGTVLVTGGAGFIGSAVVRALLADTDVKALVIASIDGSTFCTLPR